MYIIALLCSPGYIFIFWLALFDVSRFIDDLLSVESSLIFFNIALLVIPQKIGRVW